MVIVSTVILVRIVSTLIGGFMPRSAKRKPSVLGTRVLVCGKQVSKGGNLICLLPAGIVHRIHTALALDSEGSLVLAHRIEGGGRESVVYQYVPATEGLQLEQEIDG